ncbi:hypothetical protein BOX15_Mlig012779g8 [Macrostomum lignano]|uniref:Uncharacterized protein n=1 Tax=Macrostomum lignano TaxID=282301 RepID=A0A267EK13_9PLAT|nr:hypothetical protein BOX15_Mlig012779g8 [Macrostomum lignano]
MRRLDEAIALRERPSVDGDDGSGIDLAEAERRTRRLLACLTFAWSHQDGCDEEDADWMRQRRADDPFAAGASPATVSEPAQESAYGQIASNGSIDFSRVLSPWSGPENISDSGVLSASNVCKHLTNEMNDSGPQAASAENSYDSTKIITGFGPCEFSSLKKISENISKEASFYRSAHPTIDASDRKEMVESKINLERIESTSYQDMPDNFDYQEAAVEFKPSSSSNSDFPSSESLHFCEELANFDTVSAPVSLTFVHGRFYTVEGDCIRKYRLQDLRCLGKLNLTNEDDESVDVTPYSVRSCDTNDWLLIVDMVNCRVACVDSYEIVRFKFGPRVSAKYSLEDPVQVVSSGTHLFICCPEQAIFFVRISDGRTVTQTKEHLRLTRPIRLAWSEVTSRLIVMDDKDNGSYTVDVFDVTGGGIGGLSMVNDSYLKLYSNYDPDLVCLAKSGRVVYTSYGTELMQFDYYSFNIPIKMATMLCKFDEWKRLSDICVIDEDRLAVCDHKARKIYVLYAKSTNSTGNLRSEDSDRSKHTISASVTPLANDAIAGDSPVTSSTHTSQRLCSAEPSSFNYDFDRLNYKSNSGSCESSSLHNTGDKLYSADASDDESTSLSSGLFDMSDCHTIGAPKSIAFVHNRFYTVEDGCIRKYSWQDSRCLGKLALVDEDGEPMEHIRPFSLHSCATNDWLLIVDKENCCVVCVNIFGTAERIFGPRISAKYSLEDPVQAVSSGTHLFICCPEQAIFFVRISDGRTVTQTKEHLRLSRPIRLAWSEVTSRLIVMDNKDNGSYTVDVFDVTGGGIGGLSKANISYLKLDSYNEPDLVCFPESDKVVYTSNDSKVTLFGSEIFYNPPGETDSTCRFVQSQLLSGICVVCEGLVAVCDKKTRWIRVLSMK